ncbi:MAG TPA: penicillin-binding protein 2 [Patescibacteria group bacterium]|nr:penicillin-binding protein 2 [Patescibacteria group bacterium]
MQQGSSQAVRRVRIFYTLIACVIGIFLVRAFYLQVIRHDYYRKAAQADQLKEYEIPSTRGLIEAHNGDGVVPIVLNQMLYTVYADPSLVKDAGKVADALAANLGGSAENYQKQLKTPNTRYVILGKKVAPEIKTAILKHKYPGIGAQATTSRTYPNGSLASQLLGFVNNDGKGVYGLEQALNKELSGKAGRLKAVTDINGVPLAADTKNIEDAPVNGDNMVLTVNMAMQKQLETILQKGLQTAKSGSGSAIIMDPSTGAIKAMANWPTYDPGNYGNVSDPNAFNNASVSSPIEVGSIMKGLTTAAALDQGAIKANQTYNDPAHWVVDDFTITNIEEDGGAGVKSVADLLNLSLNTGATWELMQMSNPGGTQITQKGREAWHNYMVNHYRFGRATGIEQGYEAPGTIPDPNDGYARDLTYANTTFGQGMTVTPIQMAAAFSAMINGGTYYQPTLIDETIKADGTMTHNKPNPIEKNTVSPQVSQEMITMLEYVVQHHFISPPFNQSQYMVGGKTGTAQIAKPGGGYYDHEFNGTYIGFVGGDTPQYVVMVTAIQPHNGGYAGTAAAQPIFTSLAHMLIDNFGVTPKTH